MALASNIEDLYERIDFLLKEKSEFSRHNIGEYADPIVNAFDNEVYRCEIKIAEKNKKPIDFHKKTKSKNELSLAQVALIYIYEDKVISTLNADKIACDAGYTSGRALLKQYYKYLNKFDRINSSGERADKLKSKIIESTIPFLTTDESKNKAIDELKTLLSKL